LQIAASGADVKKPKLSPHTTTTGSSVSKSRRSTSKKAEKEVATTAAWMNLQGSINRLSDGLTMAMTTTDESRVAEESSQALEEMQNEENLSADDKIVLLNAFLQNARICTVYLKTKPELKLSFLRSIIQQMKASAPLGPGPQQ